MAFFTGWAAWFNGLVRDHVARATAVVLRKSDDTPDAWKSNDAGAARVYVDGGTMTATMDVSTLATQATLAVLAGLAATPTTPSTITKSDDTVTTAITAKGILVGGAGNLVVRGVGGAVDVTIVAVAGQYVPCQCSRVMAATTATGLVGLS